MKPLALLFTAVTAISGCAGTPPSPPSTPAPVASRTDVRPGCAVGVVEDGRLSEARYDGFAELETRRPIDADTTFNIASMSKQLTAAAIGQTRAVRAPTSCAWSERGTRPMRKATEAPKPNSPGFRPGRPGTPPAEGRGDPPLASPGSFGIRTRRAAPYTIFRDELAGAGVRLVSVCPGPVRTEIFERAGIDLRSMPFALEPAEVVDAGEGVEHSRTARRGLKAPGGPGRGRSAAWSDRRPEGPRQLGAARVSPKATARRAGSSSG